MPALLEIDDAALRGPVSTALGSASVRLLGWRREAIHIAFNQTTGGLYRVTGEASGIRGPVKWSLILKVVHASDDPFGGNDDPLHPNYWLRELLVYESGLLDQLPGIRAPRCFAVDRLDGATAWIWLEDVTDPVGSHWPAARYRLAARRLGEFNGAYLTGRPLPVGDHLSRQWLRKFVDDFAPAFARLSGVRDHPLVQRCWPGGQLQRVHRLWAERETFLDALERLPQTFCHLDAFPRNLMIPDGDREVVALDWSYAGMGAVGSELASMAAASACFYDLDPTQLRSIDQLVFSSYVQGLRAVGWSGPPEMVRLGHTAAASLHYALFPMGVYLLDDVLRARFEHVFGHSAIDIVDRWAEVTGFLLDRADEARGLLRRV
ncbi:MAG: aminoglycoside phosphotransferase family protein [Candidatus Dormibacteraeota bacterium]|nr:aminoglycoside phosphotransferase family protein [Candidatus Dormibacteraeota bacterium]